jgi:transposase
MTSRGAEKMIPSTIGVDISKDFLDVYRLPDGEARRFENSKAGYKMLIRWLSETPIERIIYEPTGPYHRSFEQALAKAALPLAKVNARQARRFAEATGKLAKTDRADAAMLARMGVALTIAVRPVAGEMLSELKELNLARQALIKDRTAAKNSSKILSLRLLQRQNAQRCKQIEAQITAIEEEIKARIAEDEQLAERLLILESIPGISKITAFSLLIEMPELGTLDGKQAASLAGLAPIARQSGRWIGHAFIRGGRASLRQALYMPALVAARFNPDMKVKYRALIDAGKPAKIAITAIMRKLIVLPNALLRDRRKWNENHA